MFTNKNKLSLIFVAALLAVSNQALEVEDHHHTSTLAETSV